MLGLLRNVPHLYPTSVQTFLAIASQVSSFGSAVSLDCSLPDHHRTVSKATIRTLINILAPLYVTAAAWVGWALWSLFLYHHARWRGKQGRTHGSGVPLGGLKPYFTAQDVEHDKGTHLVAVLHGPLFNILVMVFLFIFFIIFFFKVH